MAVPAPVASPPPASVADSLGDFTASGRRLPNLIVSAVLIGFVAARIAAALLGLIGCFTNRFYLGRISFTLVSPGGSSLGLLALGVPTAGGLIVGLMAVRVGAAAGPRDPRGA